MGNNNTRNPVNKWSTGRNWKFSNDETHGWKALKEMFSNPCDEGIVKL